MKYALILIVVLMSSPLSLVAMHNKKKQLLTWEDRGTDGVFNGGNRSKVVFDSSVKKVPSTSKSLSRWSNINLLGATSSVIEAISFAASAGDSMNPFVLGVTGLYAAEAVNHTLSAMELDTTSVLTPIALALINGGFAFGRFFLGTVETPVKDGFDMVHAVIEGGNALYFLTRALSISMKDMANVIPEPYNSDSNAK
jgi:hypothetical protein